jgi:hypothetical protein
VGRSVHRQRLQPPCRYRRAMTPATVPRGGSRRPNRRCWRLGRILGRSGIESKEQITFRSLRCFSRNEEACARQEQEQNAEEPLRSMAS